MIQGWETNEAQGYTISEDALLSSRPSETRPVACGLRLRSAFYAESFACGGCGYASTGIVRGLMANQDAGVGRAIVGDGQATVGADDIDVEVDQALAADGSTDGSHAVSSVAGGAGKTCNDMASVLIPTGVFHDLVGEIVALGAQAIRPVDTEIGIGKEIRDWLPRQGRMAEFIAALEDMSEP
jgi:hypothetical protein